MPLKERKIATHANATLVHSIPANSAQFEPSARPRRSAWTAAWTRTARTWTAASTTPAAALLVTRLRTGALAPNSLRRTLGAWGSSGRYDPRQPTEPPPAAGLLTRAGILLLDALLEFGKPLFHRPLDLGPRRARLFRP